MRTIPKEDIVNSQNLNTSKEYPDGVFCRCGNIIKFRNRKPRETVLVICPICNSKIIYG